MPKESRFVPPSNRITTDMVIRAQTDDPWHTAANLNAMMQDGYCRVCGLVPAGCLREGCGPRQEEALRAALSQYVGREITPELIREISVEIEQLNFHR